MLSLPGTDEFTFRALLQDNEDLFESFMKLLRSMRNCAYACNGIFSLDSKQLPTSYVVFPQATLHLQSANQIE